MSRKRDFSWHRHWKVLILCGICLFAGFLLGMLFYGSPWHLPPAWGDIPTWITGIATIGLLIGATITAIYAAKAFGKQSEEVTALQEERNREAAERRKAQAAQVFIWTETTDHPFIEGHVRSIAPHTAIIAHLNNTSQQPVYDLTIAWRNQTEPWGEPDLVGPVLMPGDQADRTRIIDPSLPGQENLSLFGAVAHFRDAAGVHWRASPNGPPEDIQAE